MGDVIYLNEWKRQRSKGAGGKPKSLPRWRAGRGHEVNPTSIGVLSAELLRLLKE